MKIKITGKLLAAYTAMILAVIMLFLPGSDTRKFSFKPEDLAAAIASGDDAITASTITSRAFLKGVEAAYKVFVELQKQQQPWEN